MQLERRTIAGRVEVREAEGQTPRIVGHAAVFNQDSLDLGFTERIAPGAFARAIAEAQDVRALWNHDPNYVLGRTAANTLALSEDSAGLRYEIDPPDAQWARDLRVSMQRGDVTQSSFSFSVVGEKWEKNDAGRWTRTLLDVDLYDVAPVTFPAYVGTDVAARMKAVGLYVAAPPLDDAALAQLDNLRARLAAAEFSVRTRA